MEAQVGVSSHGGAVVDRKFLQSHHHHHHQPPAVHQQDQIGTVPQLLAGGIAGAFSKTCTAPLARLTILFQVQGMHSDAAALSKASIWHEALRIVNEEGFRAFWKGNLVTIAHRLPYSSVNFYAYEHYKSVLKSIPGLESHRRSTSADIFVHFVGGGLAGMTAASATYPLDLVRTRLAAQLLLSEFWVGPLGTWLVIETPQTAAFGNMNFTINIHFFDNLDRLHQFSGLRLHLSTAALVDVYRDERLAAGENICYLESHVY